MPPARKSGGDPAARTTSFIAILSLGGIDFPLRLHTRPLSLGPHRIQYYWIDSAELRRMKSRAAQSNFASIVGFWHFAMHDAGHWQDLNQQSHFILAQCYALVSGSKAMQRVCRDAYLDPKVVKKDLSLPQETSTRINGIITGRSRDELRDEFDRLLGRMELPSGLLPLLQEACRQWIGRGVVLMRQHGRDGVQRFLREVAESLARLRKRSSPGVRLFLDLFAYECKAAFYTCYANLWVALILWLREHRELDEMSARFLGFWHNQNQPIELPQGRTAGGILYPVQRGIQVPPEASDGSISLRSISIPTERVGPAHLPDVFSGQILSLHPLSGIFMQDPGLCAIAGQFFGSEAWERVFQRGQADFCAEYWNLIGAILIAGNLYRQLLDNRAVRSNCSAYATVQAPVTTQLSESEYLQDFVNHLKIRCPDCRSLVRVQGWESSNLAPSSVQVHIACNCGLLPDISVSSADMAEWLLN